MGTAEELRAVIDDLQEFSRELKGDRLVLLESIERARADPDTIGTAALDVATTALAAIDGLIASRVWGESRQ
jgi:hypothetical protein